VIGEAGGLKPDVIIIGTGSELQLAIAAAGQLQAQGIAARVVSMPCWELFERQPQEYQERVLPPDVKPRVSVEAGATLGWCRYVGDQGLSIGIDRFGASAPGETTMEKFGFTIENVVAHALRALGR